MNKATSKDNINTEPMAVDINILSAMLSCGHATARKVAEQAEARIVIGRRVLYSVDKVRRYIDLMAE